MTPPPQFLKTFLVLTLIAVIVTLPVSAVTVKEFTPYFNIETNSAYGQDVAHANTTIQLQDSVAPNTTPWEVWLISGALGAALFFASLRARKSPLEVEIDLLLSIMSWAPLGYCSFASFAIDRITGYGVTSQIFNTTTQAQAQFYNHEYVYMENHLLYVEPVVGILMLLWVFIAIINSYRLLSLHRAIGGHSENTND